MKNTILNKKQADLIDSIILKYGLIVSFEKIYELLKESHSRDYVKSIVSSMVKNGWLVRIKKGIYSLSDLANRGNVTVSQLLIANTIEKKSYVSFNFALQYYGMFDQLMSTVTSISTGQYKKQVVSGITYKFVRTKEKYFYGWKYVSVDNYKVRIATCEKALIDIIQFSKSSESVDTVIEKIGDYKGNIDFKKFIAYLSKSTVSTIKFFGFIFDLLKINSSGIYDIIKNNRTVVRIDKNDRSFNSKWRVYHNNFFNKYL